MMRERPLLAAAVAAWFLLVATHVSANETTLNDDVRAAWSSPQVVLPGGDDGLLYSGESVTITGSGTIDRDHYHEEHDETVFVFFHKHVVNDHPNFVDYSSYPFEVSLAATGANPGDAGTVQPKPTATIPVGGDLLTPSRLMAFIPNVPHQNSFGTYHLVAVIDDAGRLQSIEEDLARAQKSLAQVQDENYLNQRLRTDYPQELSTALANHVKHFYPDPASQDAIGILKIALTLNPANPDASLLIANAYVASGHPEQAEAAYISAISALQARLKQSETPTDWDQLAAAEDQWAQYLLNKYQALGDTANLDLADHWYNEAATSAAKGGDPERELKEFNNQAAALFFNHSDEALEKAQHVLEAAVAVAPIRIEGNLVAQSQDGRLAVVNARNDGVVMETTSGHSWEIHDSAQLQYSIVAPDRQHQRELLEGSDGNYYWLAAGTKDVPQPAQLPDTPDLGSADRVWVTTNGFVVLNKKQVSVIDFDGKTIVLKVDGEIGSMLSPKNLGISVSPHGWIAVPVLTGPQNAGYSLSGVNSEIEVFSPDGTRVRTFQAGTVFVPAPIPPATDPDPSALVFRFPEFISIGDNGEVLYELLDVVHPDRSKWVYSSQATGDRFPDLGISASSTFSPTTSCKSDMNSWILPTCNAPAPTTSPSKFIWYAVGRDEREDWSQGAISPDGNRYAISNTADGLIIADASSDAVIQRFSFHQLGVPIPDGQNRPLGILWTDATHLLFAAGHVTGEGDLDHAWLSAIDISNKTATPLPLTANEESEVIGLGSDAGVADIIGPESYFVAALSNKLQLWDLSARKVQSESLAKLPNYYLDAELSTSKKLILDDMRIVDFDANVVTTPQFAAAGYSGNVAKMSLEPSADSLVVVQGSSDRNLTGRIDVYSLSGPDRQVAIPAEILKSTPTVSLSGAAVLLDMHDYNSYAWADVSDPTAQFAVAKLGSDKMLAFSVLGGSARFLMEDPKGNVYVVTSNGTRTSIVQPATLAAPADDNQFDIKAEADPDGGFRIVYFQEMVTTHFFRADDVVGHSESVFLVAPDLSVTKVNTPLLELGLNSLTDVWFNSDRSLAAYSATDGTNAFIAVDRTKDGTVIARLPPTSPARFGPDGILTGNDIWNLPK